MKEKKISVTHFQNHRLNDVEVHGGTIKPMYFRVTYDGKLTEFRSQSFDALLDSRAISSVKELEETVIRLDSELINQMIETLRLENKFDLKSLKQLYQQKGKNVLDLLREAKRPLAFQFFDASGFKTISRLVKRNELSIREVERVFNEFDDYTQPEYFDRLSFKYNKATMNLRYFEDEIVKYLRSHIDYLPLYKWQILMDDVLGQIDDVALSVATTFGAKPCDSSHYRKLKSFYQELVYEVSKIE